MAFPEYWEQPKPDPKRDALPLLDRINRHDLHVMKDIISRAMVTSAFWENGYITRNEANELEAKINGILFDCHVCGKEGGH